MTACKSRQEKMIWLLAYTIVLQVKSHEYIEWLFFQHSVIRNLYDFRTFWWLIYRGCLYSFSAEHQEGHSINRISISDEKSFKCSGFFASSSPTAEGIFDFPTSQGFTKLSMDSLKICHFKWFFYEKSNEIACYFDH